MSYTDIALLSLVVHCIVNYSALSSQHFEEDFSAGKTYRWLMWSIACFFFIDAIWGVLFDAQLIKAVYIVTVVYFILMTTTVFLWSRFVISYLQEENRLIKALYYIGRWFLVFVGTVLLLNVFFPIMFWFDENGAYHAGSMRYVTLFLQILMFLASTGYVMFTTKGAGKVSIRHHLAIGSFGICMSFMVILQVMYPLLPLYSIGCLLGTSVLHTFVLEDMKENRRLELEELLRREQEQRQELGSARQLAYSDSLTGVKSTHAYVEAEKRVNERISCGELIEFGVIVFDVNGLKHVNDTLGHEAGDQLLKRACRLICVTFQHSPVFRIGGDEFVAMLEGQDYQNRETLLESFENRVEENLKKGEVVLASGLAVYRPGIDHSYRRIFERADVRMYDRKSRLKAMGEGGIQ